MDKKIVNIFPRVPITTVNPPIRVPVKNVRKSIADIRKCIIAKAKVEEILNNGSTIILNLNNYDLENNVNPPTIATSEVTEVKEPVHEDANNTVAEPMVDNTVVEEHAIEDPNTVAIEPIAEIASETTTVATQPDKYGGLTKKQRRALRMKEAQERAEAEAAASSATTFEDESVSTDVVADEEHIETIDAENM